MLMKKLSTNFKQKPKASSEYIQDNLPLTLNHFLIGCSSTSDGLLNVSEKDINSRTKWKAVQAMTDMFQQCWISKKYYFFLFYCKEQAMNVQNFESGVFAILFENNVERLKGPLRRVVALFKSKDNIIRSVKVKTLTAELIINLLEIYVYWKGRKIYKHLVYLIFV